MRVTYPHFIRYLENLLDEIKNFNSIAGQLQPSPGEVPHLEGLDIHGECFPMNGLMGGDHVVYVDFNRRFDLDARIRKALDEGREDVARELDLDRGRAGILLADVAGHRLTDAVLTAMLHQAFLIGVQYELETRGTITTNLFENINARFHHSTQVGKYVTMIYGEISATGMFRFISAGHPYPIVFSNEFDRIMDIAEDRMVRYPPVGTMLERDHVDQSRHESLLGEKDPYTINEMELMGHGDILIIYTDGFAEHADADGNAYCPARLEEKLRSVKGQSAEEISHVLLEDMLDFGNPADDLSFVVIKKTA